MFVGDHKQLSGHMSLQKLCLIVSSGLFAK